MKLLKKITILLCFLSLIAFVSCSAEDKSGVKEKDNADGTEITGGGKSGNSGTGGTSGTGGGTETTITGKFPPPAGTYKDKDGKNDDTKVTIEGEKTKMERGTTNSEGDSSGFGFNITEWKKTTKDGKDIKLESVDATDAWGWGHSNISIVYYYDTQTLNITFDTALHGSGHAFLFLFC
jgi:hypothetical protein